MTSRTKTPAAAPVVTFEPDRFYAVDLARKTVWKGRPLLPADDLQLRGDVCAAIAGDIAAAQPI